MNAPPLADAPFHLPLRFVDVPLCVRTNDESIRSRLRAYFAPYVVEPMPAPSAEVILIQGRADTRGAFEDVRRGSGRRVKEAVREEPGCRLILKRTTGVLMGLTPEHAFAQGDLRSHLNQAINLVNACYAKTVLKRGHVLFHASAVTWGDRAAVLAGVPGAGKSTAALHLVEEGFRFLSNDRVLAKAGSNGDASAAQNVELLGYPKQPRVNPGTLLHHPRLTTLLESEDQKALRALSVEELWRLERKSDVDLDAIYGQGTVDLAGSMQCLILLKWRLGESGFAVRRLTAAEAMANLPIFYKDLGVFDLDRPVDRLGVVEQLQRYSAVCERVRVLEVLGGVDFSALVDLVGDELAK